MNKNIKKTGFTLAELLVVVSILGIIAVLVIPGLVRKYNKAGFEKQLGSFYNDLSQAMTIAQAETTRFLSASALATSTTGGILKNFMQIKKEPFCGAQRTPCFADSYKSIDASATVASSTFCNNGTSMMLLSGAAVCITPMTTNETYKKDNSADIFVDLNGPEPPNVGGKDLFRMNLYSDATIDEQVKPSVRQGANRENIIKKCTKSATGEGCFTQFMQDGMKFNYYD
ncbi:type II secretion system protein [bacterium]|nr:type II secretion system protein [bacterium]